MTLECLLDTTKSPPLPQDLYKDILFPAPPEDRPFLYINMVSTADGKIVIGKPGGTAKGVGGSTDQLLFRRLQNNCDAAILGSATLRAGQVIYPPEIFRIVVTRAGDLPLSNRFFTDAPKIAYVAAPEDLDEEIKTGIQARANLIQFGCGDVDLPELLKWLRREMGIRFLLCEGGSNLNEKLFRAGVVDELFLSISPKIKGGEHLPTIVGGAGFPAGVTTPLKIISIYRDDDELYLRYRITKFNKNSV